MLAAITAARDMAAAFLAALEEAAVFLATLDMVTEAFWAAADITAVVDTEAINILEVTEIRVITGGMDIMDAAFLQAI